MYHANFENVKNRFIFQKSKQLIKKFHHNSIDQCKMQNISKFG